MKQIFLILGVFALLSFLGCRDDDSPNVQVSVQPTQADLNDSLNLQAIGATAVKARSAQELEQLLNDPNTGLNNLDLENSGSVNYINVTEVPSGTSELMFSPHSLMASASLISLVATQLSPGVHTFRLSTQLSDGTVVQLADINITISGSQAQVAVQGNQQFYPQNNYVQSTVSASDLLLLAYIMTPHAVFYHPYYHYGYYPSYYHVYHPVSRSVYVSHSQSYTRSYKYTTVTKSSPSFKQTSSPAIRQPGLSGSTSSQKSFSTRTPTKSVGSGGFGAPKASTTTKSFSAPKSTSRTSSGSFGKKR